MTIDFSELALSPNKSRAARNFLGMSQAQTAEQSNLPGHKLKRFETGNYVPDNQFLQDLREFFEGQGYNFNDEDTPGAKAKSRGDVFPAGIVGKTGGSPMETDGSTSEKPGKLQRPQTANLQFMRITPLLESDQVDRVFDCIEANEAAVTAGADQKISCGFLSDSPDSGTQAKAIAMMRSLAENGVLYARLMGRELLPVNPSTGSSTAKTVGDLMCLAMSDMQSAVIDDDKKAQARRKGRAEPVEVLQALVG
ncbi:helix-turn-helix transcriptional regulator [Rhodoferax sp. BLA1]|uniref:helix-turn-helix transcriptional regulator n=1 Tax=Rhodoferax sp. BLA1 TaxID=2576062 RepID=UPI0015D1955B|nr:helix-turn-helix transcriptional regulator [Rhodoferax sp. BLA1]